MDDGEGSGRAPASRADVIVVLRGHGISGVVAAELWRLAGDLRRRTRRRGIEHAVTLDASDGQMIGSMLSGTKSGTNISPHLLALRAGQACLQLHTHPNSTSFSNLDVRVFADHAAIHTLIAVGVDGTWYMMSRGTEAESADSRTVEYEFLQELTRLTHAQVAPAEIPHLATEHVVARHGWLYDRVTG